MKIALVFTFLTLSLSSVFAQEEVKWSQYFDNQNSTLVTKAEIKEGWHLYSQHIDEFAGPVATALVFTSTQEFDLIGKTQESESIEAFDPNFESDVAYFEKEATFLQKINIKNDIQLVTTVTFMVCNDVMCLPPVDKELTIKIPSSIN